MNLLKRLSALENKQPKQQFCFSLDYFYGRDATLVRLNPGQTLSDFYNSQQTEAQNGIIN